MDIGNSAPGGGRQTTIAQKAQQAWEVNAKIHDYLLSWLGKEDVQEKELRPAPIANSPLDRVENKIGQAIEVAEKIMALVIQITRQVDDSNKK